jgi:hypothetical protein
MKRVPFFIEVWESDHNADLRVCHKVMMQLFRQKVLPLPFATSVREVADVTTSLKRQGLTPAIFIVNTFWAEGVLPDLDPYMGETPALFFRRELHSYTEGMQEVLRDGKRGRTTECIRNMTPRETSIWSYGSKTADSIAMLAAAAITRFLAQSNFREIERMNPTPTSQTA